MSAFHCYLSNELLWSLLCYCCLFSEIVDNSLKGWLLCCRKSGHLTLDICLLLVARQCFTNKKWLPQCAAHQSVPPSIFDGTSVTCESWRQSSFYFLLVSRKLKLVRHNSMTYYFRLSAQSRMQETLLAQTPNQTNKWIDMTCHDKCQCPWAVNKI